MLRVYADRSHFSHARRRDLVTPLRAHWDMREDSAWLRQHRGAIDAFRPVDRPEDADLCMLPNQWRHYVDGGRVDLAWKALHVARRAGKPFVVFSEGDYTANLPFRDAYLFETSTYRSRRDDRIFAVPPFFADTVEIKLGGELELRKKGERPSVGFCGQAGGTPRDFFGRRVRNLGQNLAWKLGLRAWEPPPFEHTVLRKQVLDTLSASPLVEDRFVIRDQYRAGLSTKNKDDSAALAASEKEFVDNILGADYTVCVRGGGNWSKRFFEALCLARLPLFIDTDCVLPFEDVIDWRRYCCWVDVADLEDAPRRIVGFHAGMDDAEYATRQREARQIWLDRLTMSGFFAHFHEHFPSFRGR